MKKTGVAADDEVGHVEEPGCLSERCSTRQIQEPGRVGERFGVAGRAIPRAGDDFRGIRSISLFPDEEEPGVAGLGEAPDERCPTRGRPASRWVGRADCERYNRAACWREMPEMAARSVSCRRLRPDAWQPGSYREDAESAREAEEAPHLVDRFLIGRGAREEEAPTLRTMPHSNRSARREGEKRRRHGVRKNHGDIGRLRSKHFRQREKIAPTVARNREQAVEDVCLSEQLLYALLDHQSDARLGECVSDRPEGGCREDEVADIPRSQDDHRTRGRKFSRIRTRRRRE